MPTQSQKRRLGVFVILVIIMLIGLLLIIGSQQFLKKQDLYSIAYKDISVSGLEIGSPVKYLGLGVGSIKDIQIDPEDISRIIVKIAVKSGTPIKISMENNIPPKHFPISRLCIQLMFLL